MRQLVFVMFGVLGACSSDGADAGKEPAVSPGVGATGATSAPVEDAAKSKDVTEARFVEQSGWIAETPTSAMRKAQWKLPASTADSKPGELVVYHFAGGGGSVEDNFVRWAQQFEQPDGSASRERATTTERHVGPFAVHEFTLTGRYIAETMPGSGVRRDEPGWALLGAVIEGPGGPYYIKAIGPEPTIVAQRASWDAFLAALVP